MWKNIITIPSLTYSVATQGECCILNCLLYLDSMGGLVVVGVQNTSRGVRMKGRMMGKRKTLFPSDRLSVCPSTIESCCIKDRESPSLAPDQRVLSISLTPSLPALQYLLLLLSLSLSPLSPFVYWLRPFLVSPPSVFHSFFLSCFLPFCPLLFFSLKFVLVLVLFWEEEEDWIKSYVSLLPHFV